jgi:hypothetical protein
MNNVFDDTMEFDRIYRSTYSMSFIMKNSAGKSYYIHFNDFANIIKLLVNGKLDGSWELRSKYGTQCLVYLGPRGTQPEVKKKKKPVKTQTNIIVDNEP